MPLLPAAAFGERFQDSVHSYNHLGITEIYSVMIEECFLIKLTSSNDSKSGICEVCVGRLREACVFKMQGQHCQAELQERLEGGLRVKEEAVLDEPPEDDAWNEPSLCSAFGASTEPLPSCARLQLELACSVRIERLRDSPCPVTSRRDPSPPCRVTSRRDPSPPCRVTSRREPSPPRPVTSHRDPTPPRPVTSHREPSPPCPVTSHREPSPPRPVTSHRDPTPPRPVTSHREPSPPCPVTSHRDPTPPRPVTSHREPSPASSLQDVPSNTTTDVQAYTHDTRPTHITQH